MEYFIIRNIFNGVYTKSMHIQYFIVFGKIMCVIYRNIVYNISYIIFYYISNIHFVIEKFRQQRDTTLIVVKNAIRKKERTKVHREKTRREGERQDR